MEETIFGAHFQPLKRGEYVSFEEMIEAKQAQNTPLPKMKKTISWPPFLVSSVFETWSSEEYDRTKIKVDYKSLFVKQDPYNIGLVLQEQYDMFSPCYENQFDVELDFGIVDGEYMDRSTELVGVLSKTHPITEPSNKEFKIVPVRRTKSLSSKLSDFTGTI